MPAPVIPVLAIIFALFAAPSFAAGTGVDTTAVLKTASEDIDAGRFDVAIGNLESLLQEDTTNADVLNMLGYANRKSGDMEDAAKWYLAALTEDPNHLGALEYQGEMFIMLGDLASAQANLDKLASICGTCEEQVDLAEALTAVNG